MPFGGIRREALKYGGSVIRQKISTSAECPRQSATKEGSRRSPGERAGEA